MDTTPSNSSLSTIKLNIGLILFSATFIFQVITLPVEFDASRRALQILQNEDILVGEEVAQARKVLWAAALTYVASAISSFLSLFRLLILFGKDDR